MRLLTIFLALLPFISVAQKTDEISDANSLEVYEPVDSARYHVRKATILSAVLPGAGQAYNRKYWKIPIVYAGIGTCIYFIADNTQNMNTFRDALIAELDDDPNTINTTQYTSSQLDEIVNTYTRWRDISWMSLAGVYVLNIIDAHVDAHLRQFEVSEDLTLRLSPMFKPELKGQAGITLTLNF